MMLALLIYSYATGTFGSRRLEPSTYDRVPVRLLTADTHPAHDTLGAVRCRHKALVPERFVKVLPLAHAVKVLPVGQITGAVDGTKVLANASKVADLQAIPPAVSLVAPVLADSGCYSEKAVSAVAQGAAGQASGTTVSAARARTSHPRSMAELAKPADPVAPAAGASVGEIRKHRLATATGKQERAGIPAVYAARPSESETGMDAGLRGLQPQTAASPGSRLQKGGGG